MIELISLVWVFAVLTAIVGFLRGWNREIIVTAGVFLAMFALFQFDSLLRGALYVNFSSDQVFLLQLLVFLLVVYVSYQTNTTDDRDNVRWQNGLLGALVGFFNGYLIMGTVWYLLDINEYPVGGIIQAPSVGSPSYDAIQSLPITILSGGAAGSGEFLAVIVIALFLFVIIAI